MAKHDVFSAERSWIIDNIFRRFVHNPIKILGDNIKEGMTVLDVGCGTGHFTVEMAKMVGRSGKVIAVDLQEAMLRKLENKIKGKDFQSVIQLRKCEEGRVGVREKVDFVLAFYVAHELPDQKNFFEEVYSLIRPGGKLLVVEPNFHVSEKDFEKSLLIAEGIRFKLNQRVRVFLSRAALFHKS